MEYQRYAYCTLFNSKYLDKGLVLCKSLIDVCENFTLYVLAMDDLCFEILSKQQLKNVVPIRLKDFENEALLNAKKNRTFGQYCWTCSSSLIKYVLERYNEDVCTYIDADMCFYSSPNILIDEMCFHNKKISIMRHRFSSKYRYTEKQVGHYCVEFNTFVNCKEAIKILDIWIAQCLDCCITDDGIHWGDQKYLDEWPELYDIVYVNENIGAGVAPWNLHQYNDISKTSGQLYCSINGRNPVPLIFYHFENLQYIDEHCVKFNAFDFWKIKRDVVNILYIPYLNRIKKEKEFLLRDYNLDIMIKKHPELSNPGIKGLLSRFVKVFRCPSMIYKYIIPARLHAKKNIICY